MLPVWQQEGLHYIFVLVEKNKNSIVRQKLLKQGREIFAKQEYKRINIVSPEENNDRHEEYQANGFNKGNLYRWFWEEV